MELHNLWWQELNVNSRYIVMKRHSVIKVSDKIIKQMYKWELQTLDEIWLSKIEKATIDGLVRFIFKYKDDFYCSEWNKAKWNNPFKVQFL